MGKLKLINYTGNKFRYTKNINNMFNLLLFQKLQFKKHNIIECEKNCLQKP